MSADCDCGWHALLEGYPWFRGEGRFPLPAYSEFMPPPRLGRKPLGHIDPLLVPDHDPFGWIVSEIEEEYELKPGLEHLASQILRELTAPARGQPAYFIAGHRSQNLERNPYWPRELAEHAGQLVHEHYVILLPLALSRTQDDVGRIRWTLFGGSEMGPERAFWKGFYSSPSDEWPVQRAHAFILNLLRDAYGIEESSPGALASLGFRILPSDRFPDSEMPAWTRRLLLDDMIPLDRLRFLLTFQPFSLLPTPIRKQYLAGRLHLLPYPGSLVFWGMPTYLKLSRELPLAIQIPILRMAARHGGPYEIRVPQSGWLHEPHPALSPDQFEQRLVRNSFARSHRWRRAHRYEDELALNPRVDTMARVLFSTSLDSMGLYDKPMARNCQIWTSDFHLLLDGPNAARERIQAAEAAVAGGGLFGYRFLFPAMRVGLHEVYWHRPLVAYARPDGTAALVSDAPLGYLTASLAEVRDSAQPVELWPLLLRRELVLSALHEFESQHDHYQHQTAHNILSLIHGRSITGKKLPANLARHLLRCPKDLSLEEWLRSLPEHASSHTVGRRMVSELEACLDPEDHSLPEPLTFRFTATRSFEEAWWQDIFQLSRGTYANKDNADCVRDSATQGALAHHHRDLERLGDHLLSRHREQIAKIGMEGLAMCGELVFQWQTDFDFPLFGGWRRNQEQSACERNLLVVIPGRNRKEAIVMADHYDTAYMEDVFDTSRGGSGARLAAAGADDNHSATATLLQAARPFLRLASEGRLERDIWLLHLTGEEFPSDCMGARHFCRSLVEGTLHMLIGNRRVDLSSTRITGALIMDMIAHNLDDARDVFQISPGRSPESFRIATAAHIANMMWNAGTRQWNHAPEREGRERGRRSRDGVTIPDTAVHPNLHGEIRLPDKPHSSLYNTDGQIFSDVGIPVLLLMENYDINRSGYHDTHDTMENIDLDYGSALAAIAIETIAQLAAAPPKK